MVATELPRGDITVAAGRRKNPLPRQTPPRHWILSPQRPRQRPETAQWPPQHLAVPEEPRRHSLIETTRPELSLVSRVQQKHSHLCLAQLGGVLKPVNPHESAHPPHVYLLSPRAEMPQPQIGPHERQQARIRPRGEGDRSHCRRVEAIGHPKTLLTIDDNNGTNARTGGSGNSGRPSPRFAPPANAAAPWPGTSTAPEAGCG